MKLLSTDDISDDFRDQIFDSAREFQELECRFGSASKEYLSGRIIATVFLEPSTRTRLSFETAALRLGAKVISVADGHSSSVTKGESLYDTLRTVGQYADAIVVRTPDYLGGLTQEQKSYLPPLISAGDNSSHPTQSLLDLYTIRQKLGRINNLRIGYCGDVRKSRTIQSLMRFLERDKSNWQYWADTTLPNSSSEINDFDSFLTSTDILYFNRIQIERHSCLRALEPTIKLTKERLDLLKKTAVILNPGPRREEMPEEFDSDPRNAYWEQMKNGLYVRMALLKAVLYREPS